MIYFLYGIIFIRCALPIISVFTDTVVEAFSLLQSFLRSKSDKIENPIVKDRKKIGFDLGDENDNL